MNTGLPNMFTLDVKTEVDDHYQLVVDITASEDDPVILDRIQIFTNDLTPDEWSDAASLSGLWTLIDDNDELVTYSKLDWQQAQQPLFVNGTVSVTNTPGAWVQLTFTGSGIWVLGAISVEGTVFSVEVVKKYGREVTRNITTHNVTRPGLDIPLYLTKLFVETDLPYANAYSYNFTLISGTMMIDFIGVDGVPVPAGAGDVWSVAMPLPTSNNLNLRIVIPAVLCALVVAVLVGFASLFLCKRYLSRRRHRLGLATDMLEKRKEETVQPFRAISTPSSNACESRTTKGSLLQIRYANSQHHHSSSSNTTTISLDDSVDSTHPISSAQGQSDSAYSESQGPSIRLPPGDYGTEDGEPLSLSHADLAKVFRRAEKLRQSDDGGESDALEPHLETLARQLANRGQ
ncbi:hypothetical protein FRC17_001012 [Serendipita sp. 399]|nr:hypothetical protein FRC17_001012 [Serendipita sp. 399]